MELSRATPPEFINRKPTPQRPRDLGALATGARLKVVEYAPAVEGKLNPKPLDDGGVPALHFTIATQMMGQHLESWLLADDPQHGNFEMGLAKVELKRGVAPNMTTAPNESLTPAGETDIEESIFAFAKAPDPADRERNQRRKHQRFEGELFAPAQNGGSSSVTVQIGEKTWTHDARCVCARHAAFEGSPFTMRIEAYWPDFRIENGKPTSVSDQANNPAVVVTLRGRAVPIAPAPDPHGGDDKPDTARPNQLTLFIFGDVRFQL